MAVVRAWLIERTTQPLRDDAVIDRATRASRKAQQLRTAPAGA